MSKEVMQQVLEDCESHYQAWRSALEFAQTKATNEADQSYWSHELKAFDRTFKALAPPAPQPAQTEQEPGVKGYAMALNEIALKLRERYKTDLLSTPLWAEFEKARNKLAASIAAPQPAQRKPLTEAQQVECLVKAGCIGTVLMSFESGPYDITRPSINASRLIEQVEAAHDIKEQK